MTVHFKYGGSTAKRTLNCAGWIALSSFFPKPKAGPAADIGTLCHEACEKLWLDPDISDSALMALEYNGQKMTQDLLDNKVIPAYNVLCELVDEYEIEDLAFPELTVNYDDEIGGTGDFVGVGKYEDIMIMADYKFGDGNIVDAADNDQMNFYSWCAIQDERHQFYHKYPHINQVVFAIIQPSHRKDEIKDVWVTSQEDVLAWGEKFLDAVDKSEAAIEIADSLKMDDAIAADSKLLPYLCAGDHCKFCPAAALCPVKTGKALQASRIDASPENLKTAENLSEIVDLADELEQWCKDVKSFAFDQISAGVDITGWKRVAKRATRNWKDPDEALKYLKRQLGATNAVKTTPITPAQAEKEAKKQDKKLNLEKYTIKQSSGDVLVKASDKRPAILSVESLEATLADSI